MDRKTSHQLLIELLAHQFAFPVRWIETQNSLFTREDAISRFVELGPAKVLTGMTRRTYDLKFATRDAANCTERKFLASTKDLKDLLYEYEAADSPDSHEDSLEQVEAKPVPKEEKPIPSNVPVIPRQAAIVATASIADVPTSALEIICAVIAHKVKRQVEQISPAKSIKELVGGKSTLQNEIVGDLGVEFGSTPDAVEDMSLNSLADALEGSRTAQLGKQTSNLIAKLISSKMPARFNINSIREHLSQTWGLGPSRQGSVLLFALSSEPQSRISTIELAKEYLDSVVARYAKAHQLILQAQTSDANPSQGSVQTTDPAVLNALSRDQRNMALKQFNILAEYLQLGTSESDKLVELEGTVKEMQEKLDLWHSEFESDFETGIQRLFDVKQGRKFNSWWNQGRQEVLQMYHKAENGMLEEVNDRLHDILRRLANRSDESLVMLVKSLIHLSVETNDRSVGFASVGMKILEYIEPGSSRSPVMKFMPMMLGPKTTVTGTGSVQYSEIPRIAGKRFKDYVAFLKNGDLTGLAADTPFVHVKSAAMGNWSVDQHLSSRLFQSFESAIRFGMNFSGKNVLVTGAGPDSIGAELVKGLLIGGARVIVTSSRPPSKSSAFYRQLYEECGSRDSELLVLPLNQGSARDCDALIDYIYERAGLGQNLDAIIPFAAISEQGIEIDGISGKSELAHRLMLLNVIRMLGRVVEQKRRLNISCCPTQVLLPLSPNHGTFGADGLYSESKLGLESLLNRFHSETWSSELTICGVVIGWTRGTGLMNTNDIVAEAIERHNVLTFSREEMSFNILVLLSADIQCLCEDQSIIVDLGGKLGMLENCKSILSDARVSINRLSDLSKAIYDADLEENKILNGETVQTSLEKEDKRRSILHLQFPSLLDFDVDIKPLDQLQGMVDLSTTVVVVGFSELGPWGSSRTRWDFEKDNKLSQEGYIEMAWMMNLIKHVDGDAKGNDYVGWVDAKTGEKVHDSDIEKQYGQYIFEHAGIRFIEPELFDGYDPKRKEYLQEIAVENDLPEFEATFATAQAFKLRHGDHASIRQVDGSDTYKVQIKSGAHILVPKSIPFSSSLVAGQLPSGWDPKKYGIDEDTVNQVDPVTLYTLCCVCEALYSAGIVDSLEIFKYIHLAEIGNYVGSSMGGTVKTRQMYKDMYLDKQVQGDVIQETYLNTPAAWVNMLLLGSTGPIKTPVGACATGVESIDIGFESIISGKTKMCIVGGTDNFQEDESYGFSTMKATVNTVEDLARGRLPSEMSRPTAETRAGFLESQGCGIQIICNAELALEMGLPIYGIIAASTMAADKVSRSVPAPGQGVLSFARETSDAVHSPLLNLDYRREQMQVCLSKTSLWRDTSFQNLYSTDSDTPLSIDSGDSEFSQPVLIDLCSQGLYSTTTASSSRIKAARRLWGNDFRAQDPNISPLRASLAVWGLTIDDLAVASMHGTSTKANDKNEAEVIHKQMTHLGRTEGRPLLAVCQKSITGHPKAPAAAWMLNGCLQIINSGVVPGNRNADNVDNVLQKYHHLVFPTSTIKTTEVKAFLLTSFGFGQKGGQVVGVAPRYLFATLEQDEFEKYAVKFKARKKLANRAYVKGMFSNALFKAQSHPPYKAEDESRIFLDPHARVSSQPTEKESPLAYDTTNIHGEFDNGLFERSSSELSMDKRSNLVVAMKQSRSWIEQAIRHRSQASFNVGVDMESLANFTSDGNHGFLARNYTDQEQMLASQSQDPHSYFVSRWCAKEAVFKSLGVTSKGAGAPLKDIEIYNEKGIPRVRLHGDTQAAAAQRGIEDIMLSLSYSDDNVIAVSLALREKATTTTMK